MNGVDAEEHRDAQPGAHRLLLHLPRVVAQHVQERACAQPRPAQRLLAPDVRIGHLHHLRDLLLERHLVKDGLRAGLAIHVCHLSHPFVI